MWLSIQAEIKLCAAPIAWISPVKWRLISSIGTTCDIPPPAAPPFIPKTGPSDGSLNAAIDLYPSLFNAWVSPTVTVDFPSPGGVGVTAVIKINFPSFLSAFLFKTSRLTLALYFP